MIKKVKEAMLSAPTEVDLEKVSIGDLIRMGVSSEEGAITLYNRIADALDEMNEGSAAEVFRDIAYEEKVHVGEFLTLLNTYEDDNKKAEEEGAKEVANLKKESIKEFFNKLKKS